MDHNTIDTVLGVMEDIESRRETSFVEDWDALRDYLKSKLPPKYEVFAVKNGDTLVYNHLHEQRLSERGVFHNEADAVARVKELREKLLSSVNGKAGQESWLYYYKKVR